MVKANKGSAGSDRQSIKDFERNLTANLDRLYHELIDGSYRPRPIWRVVSVLRTAPSQRAATLA
jgi:retron-type reverse transcriptase